MELAEKGVAIRVSGQQGEDDLGGRHNVPACDIISSIWLERGGIICPRIAWSSID